MAGPLTVRQVIALVPVVIIVLAYLHGIPIPPELMLVGDLLAYIDIFSMIFLVGPLSRVTTVLFVVKQFAADALRLTQNVLARMSRLDIRRRRETRTKSRRRPVGRARNDDDGPALVYGVACA